MPSKIDSSAGLRILLMMLKVYYFLLKNLDYYGEKHISTKAKKNSRILNRAGCPEKLWDFLNFNLKG